MKRLLLTLLITLFLLSQVQAGGFQVNLQGQKQAAMGHTGTGLLLDNACILFNPGAMSFLDSLRGISFGASFIMPRLTYLDRSSGYVSHIEKHTGTPITLYAVYKFNKAAKWNVGLGIYNPFGSKVQWPDDWKGQFLIREIDLKTFFIQPTASFKINDKLGIGAGFIYATGSFGLRKGVPLQDSTGKYGEGNLNGKASGYGFNAGVYIQVTEKLSIGINYRSQVNIKVKGGSADFVVPSSVAHFFPSTTFSTGINLPQMATLGFGYAANSKLKLALDINYVGWSSYDSLKIDFEENTEKLADIRSPRMYENTFMFRIGGQYKVNEKWMVRLGSYFDMSPVKDGYVTPEGPDANKLGITAGASFNVTKKIQVDASLLFIEGMERTDTNMETQFSGTYKSRAVVPGISLHFAF
ncbi:MAG: outer membrane protein transport protein [Bacteroidota bacterium]|nr:outer membrane protein transport protein [Bacteroidota bacterium]